MSWGAECNDNECQRQRRNSTSRGVAVLPWGAASTRVADGGKSVGNDKEAVPSALS